MPTYMIPQMPIEAAPVVLVDPATGQPTAGGSSGSAAAQPSDLVKDSTGVLISPGSMAQTLGRDAGGNVTTITAVGADNAGAAGTWIQTLTRDASGNVTTISKWVRQ